MSLIKTYKVAIVGPPKSGKKTAIGALIDLGHRCNATSAIYQIDHNTYVFVEYIVMFPSANFGDVNTIINIIDGDRIYPGHVVTKKNTVVSRRSINCVTNADRFIPLVSVLANDVFQQRLLRNGDGAKPLLERIATIAGTTAWHNPADYNTRDMTHVYNQFCKMHYKPRLYITIGIIGSNWENSARYIDTVESAVTSWWDSRTGDLNLCINSNHGKITVSLTNYIGSTDMGNVDALMFVGDPQDAIPDQLRDGYFGIPIVRAVGSSFAELMQPFEHAISNIWGLPCQISYCNQEIVIEPRNNVPANDVGVDIRPLLTDNILNASRSIRVSGGKVTFEL